MKPLFISHGSPMLTLEDTAATDFLRQLGGRLERRPTAIVAVSAHWTTAGPMVGAAPAPATIHDFYGFPRQLYQRRYPAPGAPALARRIADLLGCAEDPERGLDHGIWCPASLIWPDADLPILPLSVQPRLDPRHHYRLGQRLRPMAAEGVLILATGSLTHNLAAYGRHALDDPAEPFAAAFADWFAAATGQGRLDDLLDYRRRAPHAADNHPTDEHLLPYFVALGASGSDRGEVIHRSMEYGVIAMDAYEFQLG